MRAAFARLALVGGVVFAPMSQPLWAQEFGQVVTQILVVDRERLFRDSSFGQNISNILAEERELQEAETRRIEAELVAEELALTELRDTLSSEDFRARADAFDIKVQALRSERDTAQAQLVARIEQAQMPFLEQVTPVLAALMREAGATILLDRRSVLLSANHVDITDKAILRVDALLADQNGGDAGGDGATE